jgi:hypothetical protein
MDSPVSVGERSRATGTARGGPGCLRPTPFQHTPRFRLIVASVCAIAQKAVQTERKITSAKGHLFKEISMASWDACGNDEDKSFLAVLKVII